MRSRVRAAAIRAAARGGTTRPATIPHATPAVAAHAAAAHDDHGHDAQEPPAAGSRAAELVTCSLLVFSAILSWIAFVRVGYMGEQARVVLFPWMVSGELGIDWALRIDPLTAVMLVVVTTVSSLVHIYSIGYMAEDPYRPRFFCLPFAVHLRDAGAGDLRQPGVSCSSAGRASA